MVKRGSKETIPTSQLAASFSYSLRGKASINTEFVRLFSAIKDFSFRLSVPEPMATNAMLLSAEKYFIASHINGIF